MKRKLLSVILCTALSLGGVACGAAGESVQESSAESKTVETPAENQNEGKEEAKEEVKEETKVAKELNGSQRAVIPAVKHIPDSIRYLSKAYTVLKKCGYGFFVSCI